MVGPFAVTFDVFSALTDSRSGGAGFLQSVATRNGWPVSGSEVYDRWDAANKESHRKVTDWVSFADLSVRAMESALGQLELPSNDARRLSADLLESMVEWPLWPDVTTDSLRDIGTARLGLLSNIDDALLAGTAVTRLNVFAPELIVTSERAKAYKPSPILYESASRLIGPFVHVASSARDVRGAVSAGVACIRLARPGHSLDPAGPAPRWTAESILSLRDGIAEAAESCF